MLLKTKYGKVDAKISYIGRRAELALYCQAFSAWEYWNPQTLSRRLHSLVVKLHLNNLADKEAAAFAADQQAQTLAIESGNSTTESTPATPTLKRNSDASEPDAMPIKRRRTESGCSESQEPETSSHHSNTNTNDNTTTITITNTNDQSALFLDGNADLVQLVCSFLDTRDILRCASTCTLAAQQLPAFVTKIEVTMNALLALSVRSRTTLLHRFENLESFTLRGQGEAARFDFQDEASLVTRNVAVRSVLRSLSEATLPKLTALALDYCYSEGLQDQITRQVAHELVGPATRFPLLRVLSLAGNCVSDEGALHLYDALSLPRSGPAGLTLAPVQLLNLEQNFVGERGHVQMQELVGHFAAHGAALVVNLRGNLLMPVALSS